MLIDGFHDYDDQYRVSTDIFQFACDRYKGPNRSPKCNKNYIYEEKETPVVHYGYKDSKEDEFKIEALF